MFSILVCSLNKSYLERLTANLVLTTGNQYELLVWDNAANPKPITEVYNLLAAQARYPYWCFVHEDILFETINWSENLLVTFQNHAETGMIGVAGSKYKSRMPSGWSTGVSGLDYCNIFHYDKFDNKRHIYLNPTGSGFENVVNIDGVFMAIRREVWKDAQFNQDLLQGFHLYDIDFSFQVLKKWKLAVVFNIDILHFTQGGNFGNNWITDTIRWHAVHRKVLPLALANSLNSDLLEKKIGIFWLRRLSIENISFGNKLKWIRAGRFSKYPGSWPYLIIFLVHKLIKKNSPR